MKEVVFFFSLTTTKREGEMKTGTEDDTRAADDADTHRDNKLVAQQT